MLISDVLNQHIQNLEEQRLSLVETYGKVFGWHIFIPLLVGIVTAVIAGNPPTFFVGAGIAGLFSSMSYSATITTPFNDIKANLKKAILQDLMATFHPDIEFTYSESEQDVRNITKNTGLVNANRFEEEDVIQGIYGNTEFYISEIHLEKKKDKSRVTVFDGLLFKIRLPNKSFPKARIQSKPGLMSKIFGGYEKDPEYGFYYDTDDYARFRNSLGELFPFFRHLIHTNKDVRISVEGNEIVMFLNSDMKFLDDPEPRLKEPLLNNYYVENFTQQLNSLLFIVESLANDLNSQEIEERLELKAIEYVRNLEQEP